MKTIHGALSPHSPRTSSRVLIKYLTNDCVIPCRIIDFIELHNDIPLEDKGYMIGVPKEKEYKQNDACCLGKLTLAMRFWQTMTDKNLMKQINNDLFDDQTMREQCCEHSEWHQVVGRIATNHNNSGCILIRTEL